MHNFFRYRFQPSNLSNQITILDFTMATIDLDAINPVDVSSILQVDAERRYRSFFFPPFSDHSMLTRMGVYCGCWEQESYFSGKGVAGRIRFRVTSRLRSQPDLE